MSIDEVMERTIEYGLMMRTATISESRALNTSIRAAVEQHVADAVKAERQRQMEPPEGSKPHAYLLKKLAMVMPLFQEARDALTAITEQQRLARGISPSLADRMDAAGTYSVDDWRDVQPPTEGE